MRGAQVLGDGGSKRSIPLSLAFALQILEERGRIEGRGLDTDNGSSALQMTS